MKQYFTSMSNKKKALLSSIVLLLVLTIFIGKSFALPKPVRSIEIFSENTSFTNNDSGAWKVTKSAKWIGKGKARITFDVDSIVKTKTEYTDVIFVLDISESMTGDKLSKLKQDTTGLINSLLSKEGNKAALVTFDTTSSIISTLTDNNDELIQQVNNIEATGSTNYYQALVNVDTILTNYVEEENKSTIVLFLTDGYPNVETPNEVAQYNNLKAKYPFLTINGVQYEMGDTVLDPVKKVSDNQFVANIDNLNNVLYDASLAPIYYDEFTITDYLNNEYFEIESIDNIKASIGKVDLTEEDNTPKITWNTDNSLKTGKMETLTIDVTLKDEFLNQGGIYPTNKSTKIVSNISKSMERVEVTATPIISDIYSVIYDGNAPEGCKLTNLPVTKQHFVFDTLEIGDNKLSCNGYWLKEWEIVQKDVTKINDEYFIMPESDVTLRAVWSKLNINKSMDGKISKVQTLYNVMADSSVLDNQKSEFVSSDTGIDFSKAPSDTNGKGVYELSSTKDDKYPVYYYRGEVYNNNVKFANFCWKMVRTTSTGGVKLIYNGLPDANGDCTNSTGTATQIGTSKFNEIGNSPADIGYMYGDRIAYGRNMDTWYSLNGKSEDFYSLLYNRGFMTNTNYYYSDSVSYDSKTDTYILNNATQTLWEGNYDNLVGKYTCFSTNTSCIGPYYIVRTGSSSAYYRYAGQEKIGLGKTVNYNNGTYTITDYIELDASEYFNSKYNLYAGYYFCPNNTNTCSEIYYANSSYSTNINKISMTNGETYDSLYKNAADIKWVYGNDVIWDGTNYTLVDTVESSRINWSTDRINLTEKYHYTCMSDSKTCTSVAYVYYFFDSESIYYLDLTGGDNIESAKEKMFTNINSSTIKQVIDAWYEANMTGYTKYLENTEWCNDRSIHSGGLKGKDVSGMDTSRFGARERNEFAFNPSVECPNEKDKLKVGNGLVYPIALLTSDELTMAGNGSDGYSSNGYLSTGQSWWTISPSYAAGSDIYGQILYYGGDSGSSDAEYSWGVRPAISIAYGIRTTGGDGTANDPYILEIDDYSITVESLNITANVDRALEGKVITLSPKDDNYRVASFKLNGTLVNGNNFIMPAENVVISDVVIRDLKTEVVESEHNPYPNNQKNVVYLDKTFNEVSSLIVTLDYQTENINYDMIRLYDRNGNIINNKTYGGTTRKTETITIPDNYLKIVFTTDYSDNNYYGFKATITY